MSFVLYIAKIYAAYLERYTNWLDQNPSRVFLSQLANVMLGFCVPAAILVGLPYLTGSRASSLLIIPYFLLALPFIVLLYVGKERHLEKESKKEWLRRKNMPWKK